MKKLSKYLVIASILLFFQCCVELAPYPEYYQIKNETGSDVFIKFYYSVVTSAKQYDSFNLKNNESSEEFYAMVGGGTGNQKAFIRISDSIDIYINNKLVKRYKRIYQTNEIRPKKSLYYDFNYDTIIKSENGHDVNVYRILKSDFE